VTILSRLFLLVAVALLPAIAIQAFNEFDLRRARQVEVQNHALSLARLAAAEQQQIVQGIRQVLRNVRTPIDKNEGQPSMRCLFGCDTAAISGVHQVSRHRLEWPVLLQHEQRPLANQHRCAALLRQHLGDR